MGKNVGPPGCLFWVFGKPLLGEGLWKNHTTLVAAWLWLGFGNEKPWLGNPKTLGLGKPPTWAWETGNQTFGKKVLAKLLEKMGNCVAKTGPNLVAGPLFCRQQQCDEKKWKMVLVGRKKFKG